MQVMNTVVANPNIQGGLPCFAGTRVPVSILFDHLKKGYTLGEFLADFPSVPRELAELVLDQASDDVPQHALDVSPS